MKQTIVSLTTITFLLSGCGGSTPTPSEVKVKKTTTKITLSKPIEKVSNLPSWIVSPSNKDGYICEVGSCAISENTKMTKKVALIQAKSNISSQIETYIDSQVKLKTDCISDECKSTISSQITAQSTNMIRNVKVVDNYTDTNENLYYVRACSKI